MKPEEMDNSTLLFLYEDGFHRDWPDARVRRDYCKAEIYHRLQKGEGANKALKLATLLLADQLGKCPKLLCWPCPGGNECTNSFDSCWFLYLIEKAGEKK